MSSKEHIQLGWVVRWVLSTPPGHPAARRCVRVVPVLPLLLCTRPARARPSVGGQSPTPAPRQLPWSPPRAWRSGRLAALQFSRNPQIAIRSSRSQIETRDYVLPRSLRRRRPSSSRRRRSHGRMAHGLVSDVLENGSHRCVPLACFTASEITNHPVSFTTATFSPPPAERRRTTEMGVFQTPGHDL